jgi:hypothetical protein
MAVTDVTEKLWKTAPDVESVTTSTCAFRYPLDSYRFDARRPLSAGSCPQPMQQRDGAPLRTLLVPVYQSIQQIEGCSGMRIELG